MIFALSVSQSAATAVVAVLGIIGTFLGPQLLHRKEFEAERVRWARNRRVDVYLRITASYLDALISLQDFHATHLQVTSSGSDLQALVARVDQLRAQAPHTRTREQEANLAAAFADCARGREALAERTAQLEAELENRKAQLDANYVHFKDQQTPLRLLASEDVQTVAQAVLIEMTKLLGETVVRSELDLEPLYAQWALLDVAMRRDLGIDG